MEFKSSKYTLEIKKAGNQIHCTLKDVDLKDLKNTWNFPMYFTSETFTKIIQYLFDLADELCSECKWKDFKLKEATSLGSDYAEYYDRKFDAEGCLDIKENALIFERPSNESLILYKFNKRRLESFLYDVKVKNY